MTIGSSRPRRVSAIGQADVGAQRAGFGRAVQLRLREAPQRDDRQRHDRHGQQVGDPGAGESGQDTADQGAHDQGRAVDEPVAADVQLELRAFAGLLEDGVVDDRVDRPRAQREADPQHQRTEDVGGHVLAEAADQRADSQRSVGRHEDRAAAPSIGQDPGGHLEDRDDGGVRGGHQADARRVEADLVHEELLHRNPEHEALQERGQMQRPQPHLQRSGRSQDGEHRGSSGLVGITETSELRRDPRHPSRSGSVAMSRTLGGLRRLR
jgi:hypothetical protein